MNDKFDFKMNVRKIKLNVQVRHPVLVVLTSLTGYLLAHSSHSCCKYEMAM